MAGTSFSASTAYINDSLELAGRVANETGSIGFIRSGYINRTSGVDVLVIKKDASSPSYSPTDVPAALNSSYAFARNYYVYSDGPLQNASGMWIYYVLNEKRGQKIMAEFGFIPLNATDLNTSRKNIQSTSDIPVTGYKIYRQAQNGSSDVFETNQTYYNDSSVKPSTNYTYSISAMYSSEEGNRTTALNVSVPQASGNSSSSTTASSSEFTGVIALGAIAAIALGSFIIIFKSLPKRKQ